MSLKHEIHFCPVCGSENIDREELVCEDTDVCIDYYCKDCESNGDIKISVNKNSDQDEAVAS